MCCKIFGYLYCFPNAMEEKCFITVTGSAILAKLLVRKSTRLKNYPFSFLIFLNLFKSWSEILISSFYSFKGVKFMDKIVQNFLLKLAKCRRACNFFAIRLRIPITFWNDVNICCSFNSKTGLKNMTQSFLKIYKGTFFGDTLFICMLFRYDKWRRGSCSLSSYDIRYHILLHFSN